MTYGLRMLVGGVLAVYAWRWMSPADTEAPDDVLDMVDRAMMKVASAAGAWYPPEPYNDWIAATEEHYGLPENLLARLLYQECRYREDIISGAVRSPAGALGIAQFMPATARDLGIDPLDPSQAIDAAGRYLAWLYGRLGDWGLTLAAYNWGIGNVTRKGIQNAPRETLAYVNDIMRDIA
jgi:soluble lytic murein transglycosylase-like protein